MLQLIARGPRPGGLWLSSCRKRTKRPDLVLACHRKTVSISATCQRCLDTVNLFLCAHAQFRIQPADLSSLAVADQQNCYIQHCDRACVIRSTSPGGRTFRSAFLTGSCRPPGDVWHPVFVRAECWPLRPPQNAGLSGCHVDHPPECCLLDSPLCALRSCIMLFTSGRNGLACVSGWHVACAGI